MSDEPHHFKTLPDYNKGHIDEFHELQRDPWHWAFHDLLLQACFRHTLLRSHLDQFRNSSAASAVQKHSRSLQKCVVACTHKGKTLIISTIPFMTYGTGTSTICSKILPDSRSVEVTLITPRLCFWLRQSDPRFVDGCAHEAHTESPPRCLSKSVAPPPRRFAPRPAVTERR